MNRSQQSERRFCTSIERANSAAFRRKRLPAAEEFEQGVCTLCGRRTRNWAEYDVATGLCQWLQCMTAVEQKPALGADASHERPDGLPPK